MEFALALGAFVAVIMIAVQMLIAVNAQLDVDLMAREAARVAIRAADPTASARRTVTALDRSATVEVTTDGLLLTVTVRRSTPGLAQLVGLDTVEGRVVMALEPP